METLKDLAFFTKEHPDFLKWVFGLLTLLVAGPLSLMWIRGGKLRKVQVTNDKLFVDMNDRVAKLHAELAEVREAQSDVQQELLETRAQLKSAQLDLSSIKKLSETRAKEIESLKKKVSDLQERERALLKQLKK